MTDYLFSRPGFLGGMARTMDMFGTFAEYNRSASADDADSIAIYNDWKSVGQDLRMAISRIKAEKNLNGQKK